MKNPFKKQPQKTIKQYAQEAILIKYYHNKYPTTTPQLIEQTLKR